MKKKAQMQMGESIAIIVIVLLLIVGSMVFYAKIKAASIGEKKSLFQELDVIKLSQVAYGLSEVQCSFAEVSDYGCIDILKFTYLSNLINTSSGKTYFYYRELFGTSKIYLKSINNTGGVTYYELYHNKRNSTGNSSTFMPTIIYNPITGHNTFGILTVVKYD
ncbi:MAG: hypothetical protein KJ583_02515 [Nanoarchaeota archaeon]|nr:hypothetical protein [Nanoarchaeota archaeon]MBU1269926.1 hypothetical protein [Nanoarchaeota archaeon]MBU1604167.1 hypothetical protein [Nanoarchaeota archaeon]MBU2443068.1 hypothetical protein [Nanoarchaeota archaeon]